MGLDISLYDGSQYVDEKSDLYPEHYCNKGYLRSSYNSSGFNNVVGTMVGKEMHYIFDPLEDIETEDGDYISPIYSKEHLEAARLRAIEVRDDLKNALPFKLDTFSIGNIFDQRKYTPLSTLRAEEAYALFLDYWKNGQSPSEESFAYFNKEALLMYACIQGLDDNGVPTHHLVSKVWDEPFVHTFTSVLASPQDETPEKTVRREGVLSIFSDHERDNTDNYSCYDGSFFLSDPRKIHGILPGCDFLGQPALHVIFEVSKDWLRYYQEQAAIIVEFIEKALTLDKPRIVWSS